MRSDYLLLGGSSAAEELDADGALDYLRRAGFDGGTLKKARVGVGPAARRAFEFEPVGKNYCDFCWAPIMGGEFDRLRDGRERCTRCSETIVETQEELADLITVTRRYFTLALGTNLDVAIDVKMVNAKEIAKRTGERFEPTPGVDSRILGYATSGPEGYSLCIENGAPRLATISTVAHELTHIWQYLNWKRGMVETYYGAENKLTVYEGMATWTQVQYLMSIGEHEFAERQRAYAEGRRDEYGEGFRLFVQRYPLRKGGVVGFDTPFDFARPL